jgi:hypothetical protein
LSVADSEAVTIRHILVAAPRRALVVTTLSVAEYEAREESPPTSPIRTHTQEERQGTVINGLDCGFLQLVVVTSEELEYMKVRTHKVGTRASEAA